MAEGKSRIGCGGLIIGIIAILFIFAVIRTDKSPPQGPASPVTSEQKERESVTEIQAAKADVARQERIAATEWSYQEFSDDMSKGKVKQASVMSLDTVDFRFPYNGKQRAKLVIRSHPRHGKDIILSLEKAQFLCRYDECSVLAKFDDGKAQKFNAVEPSDHSTNVLFIKGFDKFVSAAKKAKNVAIEAEFYQEGGRAFHFDVDGLKW